MVVTKNFEVLVVEDSRVYQKLILELLADGDFNVHLAKNGVQARAYLAKSTPDLVLLDVILPDENGVDLCRVLKESTRTFQIPLILLTAMDDRLDKVQGLDAGADDYITKPFHPDVLMAKINAQLRMKRMQMAIRKRHEKSVVVIADDSAAARENLTNLLEGAQYQVISCEDGIKALESITRSLPDLIILDFLMPGLDGVQVCKRLKENPMTEQIPILMVTGKADVSDRIAGLNAGADDYIVKPFHPDELQARINAMLRTRKMRLETERDLLAEKNFELQELNRQLKDTQAKLVQNEKMVALGQLVAGVAHEINNPLSFVVNNVANFINAMNDYGELIEIYTTLKKGAAPDALARIKTMEDALDFPFMRESLPNLANDIKEGLVRIRKIVLDLRNFSRLDEAERKKADLREGLESTLNLLGHHFRRQIKCHKQLDEIPSIYCCPGQLNQVFMNILINATQAIEGEGEIWVSTEASEQWVSVKIRDNGPGIPADVQTRIFEPFFTTKDVGKGTGLGLSLSYSIIEKHNGHLECHSSEAGTEFTIRLPRDEVINES